MRVSTTLGLRIGQEVALPMVAVGPLHASHFLSLPIGDERQLPADGGAIGPDAPNGRF